MGVRARPADVAIIVANTSDQCAFPRHDLNDPNYYNAANALGVTMRIDAVRSGPARTRVGGLSTSLELEEEAVDLLSQLTGDRSEIFRNLFHLCSIAPRLLRHLS